MSAAKRHVGIQFIHSTGPKQRDDGTRKLIRRHVMLGKNLGKRRELKTGASTRASRVHDKEKRPSEKNVGEQPPRAAIPPRVGSDLSLVRFADDIDPSVMSVVLKFSHRIKAFPIEDCFIFQHKYEKWVQPLTFDAAYLNALAFSTQAFVNRPTSHQGMWTLNNVGLIHLSRTLNLLRERLGEEDHDLRLSDSTCFVVLSLAMYAQRRAEFNVAKHHMAGLSKIIELRGGVASFKGNMKLLLEIVRCDVSLTLQSGSSVIHNASIPFIQSHATETGPHSPKRSGSLSTPAVFPSMDESLAFEWNVLENFCSLINESAHQKDGLSPDVLVDTVVSPMYRLLGLKYEQHSPNEAIRLGLLSFCAGVFLHCRYLRPAGLRLSDALKSCLLHLPPASVTPQELLWLLVIGAGSVFDEEDNLWLRPWLKSTLHLCDVTSWEQTHGILKSFLWIKPVHDTLGQELIAAMVFDGGEGATSALAAPPEVVRSVFLDFERYEEWRKDAFMPYAVTHPRGRPGLSLTKDDKLDTTFSGLKIQVTIIRNTPMEFRWAGSTLAGAFRGEHYFGFEESKTTPGTTNFIHGEDYAGWLSFLFKPGWPLRVSTMEMYAKFSQDLKERVEKVHLIGKPAMVNSE